MKRNATLLLTIIIALAFTLSGAASAEAATDGQADVVIIGAGGAGMAAAIQAADAGASVILLEKMDYAGGNFIRSEGGMNAAGTVFQKALGIEDTPQAMVDDTMKGGKNISDIELVNFMAQNSSDTIDWLTGLGMDMSEPAQGAGASYPRMHRSAGGAKIGGVLVPVLMENLEKRGITILYGTKAVSLIKDGAAITGVIAQDKTGDELTFKGNSIIIATGGFGASEEQFAKYRPDLAGFSTTNHPGATGDGIVMAQDVGAAVVDMEQIQTNPTVEPTTRIVLSETVRGNGAIMVNVEGNRFIAEMLTRDVLSAAILEQPEKYAWLIFDQRVMDSMAALQQDDRMGIVSRGETPEALAEAISVPGEALRASIEGWNAAVAGNSDPLGRETGMMDLSTGPWYAIKVSPAVHYTMGGIKIDTQTQVISTEGEIIPGLYAAGETTGGVHGANRLGGNAVADAMVFGKRAGEVASEYALQLGHMELVVPDGGEISPLAEGNYTDGEYIATAPGRNGAIELRIVVYGGNITQIEVLSHSETQAIFQAVERDLIPGVIASQSTDVDIISGATMSSDAVLAAIDSVLS
ncbi:MAG: flavocytochrome c [Clostridia bacterium]|nr:flavocytochrome c [Clostridia bacterium]